MSALKAFCIFFNVSLASEFGNGLLHSVMTLNYNFAITAVVIFVKTLDIIIAQLTELLQNLPTLPSASLFHATGWHTRL